MDQLSIDIHDHAGTIVLALSGSASMTTVHELERHVIRLSARRPRRVVVDLTGLTFISSLAIGMLVGLKRAIVEGGGRVSMVVTGGEIMKAVNRCRLPDVIPAFQAREEAQAHVESAESAGGPGGRAEG